MASSISIPYIPIYGLTIFPVNFNSSIIFRASSLGIANPNPSTVVSVTLTVFIPITSPFALTSAPPLLPGFIAASVWINWYVLPSVVIVLFNAEIYPTVTLPANSWPSGLPIATASSPTCKSEDLPNVAGVSPVASIFSNARSVTESVPIISAIYSSWLDKVTVTCALVDEIASSTTW